MIRKLVTAFAAVAALATASLSLSISPAAAHHWGGGGFHHSHFGGLRVYTGYGYDSCLRTRWVVNRYGNLVPRTFNVCY